MTEGGAPVQAGLWEEFRFLLMDDDEAWALALTWAAAPVVESEPYVKSDEEREQDKADWRIYEDQKRDDQAEIKARAAGARRALRGLKRLTPENRKKRARFVLYCPASRQPCRLYVAYKWTPPPEARIGTDDTLLVVASTRNGQRAAYPSWRLTKEAIDPDQWLPVGCHHGVGRFPIGVPGAMLQTSYTATTAVHRRRITDLLNLADVAWTPSTPGTSMLS